MTSTEPTSSSEHKTVLIWRRAWLQPSETFIRGQMESMTHWRPVAAGLYRVDSPLSKSADDVYFERLPPRSRLLSRLQEELFTGLAVRRAIREYHPSVIHVHFLRDALRVVPIAQRHGIPTVITVHGFDITRWPKARAFPRLAQPALRWSRQRTAGRTLRKADWVVAVSEMLRERVISLGADSSRTKVLPMGVQIPPFDSTSAMHRRGVIFVGRLVEVKGVSDLLEAWASLPHELTDQHPLVVIGDGPLRRDLESRAAELGVEVDFRGAQPQEAVFAALSNAAVFCGPSRTAAAGDTEAFGIVFLEAAAHGLPVVAYHHGGVPEAVVDGSTGLLAPEGDVAALGERLESVLRDNQLRASLGAAGQDRVRERFDVHACTARLEDLYESIQVPRA